MARPQGHRTPIYNVELTEQQEVALAFLELAAEGEKSIRDPELRYLSTRNIARWPFPIRKTVLTDYPDQPRLTRVKAGVDEFDYLVRIFPTLGLSKRDFQVAWLRASGMGWRRICFQDGRYGVTIRSIFLDVLNQLGPHLTKFYNR